MYLSTRLDISIQAVRTAVPYEQRYVLVIGQVVEQSRYLIVLIHTAMSQTDKNTVAAHLWSIAPTLHWLSYHYATYYLSKCLAIKCYARIAIIYVKLLNYLNVHTLKFRMMNGTVNFYELLFVK